ncbi:uncharacterized protein Tco025E_08425 [Trypanosoma conorhini]|uniref:Uncharacterized protein n=1 Tax=Trypanosoma conorhini TaxID=83891 RepID=A0A422NA39_9TRYP|nr:uncharacterized protein Tco025E_08425 [Trypanosoma conorhini]RNF02286.1 hypothetical protein Tco025E_08425 [Trypanosoma conorhini]
MPGSAGNEQIIAYDSDGDGAAGGRVAPHRAVAKRAEVVLMQQQSFRSVGGREEGRRQLTGLGEAYGELCRGAPLSVWVVAPACAPRGAGEGSKKETPTTAVLRTPEKRRSACDGGILVPTPKTGGGVCGYRSPLPRKTFPPSILSAPSPVSPCKGSPLGSEGSAAKSGCASSRAAESQPLTPDASTTTSLLSQAERSAAELLAHDIDSVARECWRESQQQLSPSAIYAEDDRLAAFAAAANTTSSNGERKRKRHCGVRDSVPPGSFVDGTARCLQFEPDSCSVRPLRPSVSGMVQQHFNKLTQQRLALQCFTLPY